VTGTLDLVKQEITSAEKRTDFQEVNVVHGTRSVNWSINSELFGADYEMLFAALCRKNFAAIADVDETTTSDEFTISSGVLTRGNGSASFITDGLYEGLIVRLTGMNTAGNNNRNFRITSMTATTLTLAAVDGGDAVANDSGGGGSASITVPGEYTFIPETAHTSDTFTIEKHETKTDTSHIARGCKVGAAELSVQPDQSVSLSFSGLGIDRRSLSAVSAPVLTSPTAAGTGPAMSAGIGFIRVGGSSVGCITGLTLNLDLGVNNSPAIFANTSCELFYGRAVQVTGSFTALKDGITLSDYFDNETEVTLDFMIEAPGSAPKAFYNLYLKRVKLNSADEDDPDGPTIQTFSFRATKPEAVTGVNSTALLFQDSSIS
jgi:hypothetical protein